MKCQRCGHEQETGKTCEACGASLEEEQVVSESPNSSESSNQEEQPRTEAAPSNTTTPVAVKTTEKGQQEAYSEPVVDPHFEKMKEKSKQYWKYFLHFIKQPTSVFPMPQPELGNALISIGIFVIFYAWIPLLLARNFTPSFLEIVMYFIFGFVALLVFGAIIIAISTFTIFIINKLFGPNVSYKEIISHYGAFITPVLPVLVLAFLFALIRVSFLGTFLLTIASMVAFSIVPIYMMIRYLAKESKLIDSFYALLLYILINSILLGIIFLIYLASLAGSLIRTIIPFI